MQAKIAAESPEINLTVFIGDKGTIAKTNMPARKLKMLPEVSINSALAMDAIHRVFASIHDYRFDNVNTVGKGGRIQVLQTVGRHGDVQEEWVEIEHSNRVTARWIFAREVQKTYAKAINLCDIEDPRFDAMVEYNSPAAEHIRESARRMVAAYIDNSRIVQNFVDSSPVPGITVDPSNITRFTFSIHEGYSDLNSLEKEFAFALDKTKRVWFRNASRGLFEIPLLTHGRTKNFNPDFVVWVDRGIVAIDTKGEHLIAEDSSRKLFDIEKVGTGPDLTIRLVTRGEWNIHIEPTSNKEGFTVWMLQNGRPHPTYVTNITEAIALCLR